MFFALLLGELQARDGAVDHGFLYLDEIAVGECHAENRVDLGAARKEDSDAGPIVIIHGAAETVPSLERRH